MTGGGILHGLALALFLGPVLVGAAVDFVSFRIPNLVPITLFLAFPVVALLSDGPHLAWADHLLGGACGLALGILAFALRVMGGGDGKLLAAIALWGGLTHLLGLLLVMGACGGALAVALLTVRAWGAGALLSAAGVHWQVFDKAAPIPYGVAIAGAALWLVGQTGGPF